MSEKEKMVREKRFSIEAKTFKKEKLHTDLVRKRPLLPQGAQLEDKSDWCKTSKEGD
jgi:hypothetical protein